MKILKTTLLVSVLALTLVGCNKAGVRAVNQDRMAMATVLTNALIAVSESPSATDDFAMGVLIGQGTFKIQNADTFIDYAKGAGMFLREALPWGQLLIRPGNSYDGAMFEAGGNILFDSAMADGQSNLNLWNQLGNDQNFAHTTHAPAVEEPSEPME